MKTVRQSRWILLSWIKMSFLVANQDVILATCILSLEIIHQNLIYVSRWTHQCALINYSLEYVDCSEVDIVALKEFNYTSTCLLAFLKADFRCAPFAYNCRIALRKDMSSKLAFERSPSVSEDCPTELTDSVVLNDNRIPSSSYILVAKMLYLRLASYLSSKLEKLTPESYLSSAKRISAHG